MSFLEHLAAYDEARRARNRIYNPTIPDGPVLVYGRDYHITEDGKVVDTPRRLGWAWEVVRALAGRWRR